MHMSNSRTPQPYTSADAGVMDHRATIQGKAVTAEAIQDWLIANLVDSLSVERSQIGIDEPFSDYGLDSLAALGLVGDLESWLGLRLVRPFTSFCVCTTV